MDRTIDPMEMNTSKVMPVLAGAAGGVILVAAVLAGGIWFDNLELKRRVATLRDQNQSTLGDLAVAQRASQTAQAALEAQAAAIEALEEEVRTLRSQVDAAVARSSSERRAVRAQVYAGRRVLGEGWVLTGGADTNGVASGAVVSLDERMLKSLFEAAAKEVVAAGGSRDITVNHNYANPPYWGNYWPVVWSGSPSRPPSTNRPPAGGITPPSTSLPPANVGGGAAGIWRPTQRPFLPNPSPWPGVTPPTASPRPSPRVNPALPATQPVLLP